MTAGVDMGRKKAVPKKGQKPPTFRTIGVRAATEWADWLVRLAKHCRTDTAKLVDAAVVDYAKSKGFKEEPPERMP